MVPTTTWPRAYRDAVAQRPEAVVAEALACLRAHRAAGDRVVVATSAEETLARGLLAALGLADVEVVGSSGWTRAHGEEKVRALTGRGFPPPWSAVYSDSASDLPAVRRHAASRPRQRVVLGGRAGRPGAGRPARQAGVELMRADVVARLTSCGDRIRVHH